MDRPQQVRPAGASPRPRAARKRLAPSLVTPDSSNTTTTTTNQTSATAATETTTETPAGPSYSADANEAVSLRLVARAEDVVDDVAASAAARDSFHPAYTHQIFGDAQRILGYTGLHAEVLFAAGSMRAFVRAAWAERRPDGAADTNPAVTLARKLARAEPCATLADFRAAVAAESEPGQTVFAPPGKLVCGCLTVSLTAFILTEPIVTVTHICTDTETCSDDAESTYEMFFDDISDANADGRARLLNLRAQLMVLLFIDGSSYIRTAERGWRGFFLFRHHQPTNRYALLGFCTAYEFWHVPDRIRLRISQILIFPPYQRQGHGSLFLFFSSLRPQTLTLAFASPSQPVPSALCGRHLPLCPRGCARVRRHSGRP